MKSLHSKQFKLKNREARGVGMKDLNSKKDAREEKIK